LSDACPELQVRDDTTELSGQASDKPRGRKPRDVLALLDSYGDLSACDGAVGRDLAMCEDGDGTVMCNGGTTMPGFLLMIGPKAIGLQRRKKHCTIGAVR
jgi:hypothetical protein